MKTAILVIDMQRGLCEGEGKAHDCDGVIANINRVTQQAQRPALIFAPCHLRRSYVHHS